MAAIAFGVVKRITLRGQHFWHSAVGLNLHAVVLHQPEFQGSSNLRQSIYGDF